MHHYIKYYGVSWLPARKYVEDALAAAKVGRCRSNLSNPRCKRQELRT